MREKYESLSLSVLKDLAKARGMKGISAMKKSALIEAMLAEDAKNQDSSVRENGSTIQENDSTKEYSVITEDRAVQETWPASENRAVQEMRPASENRAVQETRPASENRAVQETRPARENRPVQEQKRYQQGQGRIAADPTEQRRMRPAGQELRRDVTSVRRQRPESPEMRQERPEVRQERMEMRQERPEVRQERPEMRQERTEVRQERPEIRQERAEISESRQENVETRPENTDRPPAELSQLDSGVTVSGILEVMPDGYGFIRSDNYLPGENDVYVSPSQIRRFNLKTGDIICGNTRIKSQQEKFSALLYLKTINDKIPSEAMKRYNFEDMTPVFPNERLRMERGSRAIAMRIVDLFSPIGKGQRGMIVSPPKAGKTTLLKDVARSILQNDPKMRLLILLIDERPEEVTDIKEAIQGDNVEVIYSTFDELPEHHKRVSEMVIERAKRLVEQKENVTILLDSITRLARAYNLTVPPSGRTLSGGLDPAALHMPKRFFGAARKMREGGSLTILATALVDTGSKMDDVVYEEFKGTGNMELVLDRKLSEKRVFPAIDIPKSGTRREDLLLDREEQEAVYIMRRALNGMKSDEAVENILNTFVHTKDNRELVARVRRQKFI